MTDLQPAAVPPSRIPEFKDLEDEAAWWDTHDITDYLDELKPIDLETAPNVHSVFRLMLGLRMEDWEALERMAGAREARSEDLAADWLTERIRQEALTPAETAP